MKQKVPFHTNVKFQIALITQTALTKKSALQPALFSWWKSRGLQAALVLEVGGLDVIHQPLHCIINDVIADAWLDSLQDTDILGMRRLVGVKVSLLQLWCTNRGLHHALFFAKMVLHNLQKRRRKLRFCFLLRGELLEGGLGIIFRVKRNVKNLLWEYPRLESCKSIWFYFSPPPPSEIKWSAHKIDPPVNILSQH